MSALSSRSRAATKAGAACCVTTRDETDRKRPAEAWLLQGREGEGDVDAAGGRLGIFAAASGDDYVLAAGDRVGHGRGVAGERERGLPQKGAGGFVVGAEFS